MKVLDRVDSQTVDLDSIVASVIKEVTVDYPQIPIIL